MPTLARPVYVPRMKRRASQARLVGSKTFSPSSISGMIFWYDATVGVTDAGGGAVSVWADQSGNGRDLTAAGTARPTTGTRTQNAKNVIDFDGSTDRMSTATFTQAQPVTLFAVVATDDTTSGAAYNGQFVSDAQSTASPTMFVYEPTSGALEWAYYATTIQKSTTSVDANGHALTGIFNGASSSLRLDGASISTANPGSSGWSADALHIGGNALANFFDGWIAEVLGYNSSLSATDYGKVESYLRGKWGTP